MRATYRQQNISEREAPDWAAVQSLCLAALEEHRRSRRWSNIFKMIAITFLVVFMMAIYSNQYLAVRAGLAKQNGEACSGHLQAGTTPGAAQINAQASSL